MTLLHNRRFARLAAFIVAALLCSAIPLLSADLKLGFQPKAYAIKGAKIIAAPGVVYEKGTVVVRNGTIESVGPADKVTIPVDAEVVDAAGMTVYPGFLDMYTNLGVPVGIQRSLTGPGRGIRYNDWALPRTPEDNRNGMTPEFEVATVLDLPENIVDERRKLGFTDILSAPGGAIATGQGALVSLSGLPRRESLVKTPIGLHVHLSMPSDGAPQAPPTPGVPGGRRFNQQAAIPASGGYPRSLMGIVAHLRQTMLDASHNQEIRAYAAENPGVRAAFDPALSAFDSARSGKIAVWWQAETRDEIHRALDLSEEFGVKPVIVGGREAGRVAARLKAGNVPVILKLNYPDEPKVPSEADYANQKADERDTPRRVLVDRQAHWKERVETAKALELEGVAFAFSSDGLQNAATFHAQVRKAISNGLKTEAALAALTRNAAEIAGVSNQLGTIEPGKLGHLIVMTGPYGDEKAKFRYAFIDGQKFDFEKGSTPAGAAEGKRKGRRGEPSKGESKDKDDPTSKDEPRTKDDPKAKEDTKAMEEPKVEAKPAAATAKIETPKTAAAKPETPKSETPKSETPKTAAAKSETPKSEITKTAAAKSETPKNETPKTAAADPAAKKDEAVKKEAVAKKDDQTKKEEPAAKGAPFVDVASELDSDRKPTIKTNGNVLIKDATILTITHGTIPKGSILVKNGEIAAVGESVEAPEGFTVIDARGLVVMPGIIDTHSHIAIQGGVNEMSLSIVPEVRVKDVVDGADPMIFRALAGGVTEARLLHGSANVIGGQDAVIKLHPRRPARDLIIKDSPQGVKFALGENVTRSRGRFPNTRMGVEAAIERAFLEGKAYAAMWQAYNAERAQGKPVPPPRRDLRLEALAGILDGSIKIHSHCYRNDEILMLLRTTARHGVRVQSLQHVLEGYKVAPEIAAAGASTSTFADWWAYKVEAYDAIPFNSALMTQAGVKVCIKSDDDELMRHLNADAAKMMKYGGVTETQALEMITLNPARQLGLDQRLGSIDIGKDADLILYNGHPFDAFSRVELSLIDGEVEFQRKEADGKYAPRPGDHSVPPLASADARAKTLEIPKPTTVNGSYAIVGATLHPISSSVIENGTLIVSGGKIAALGGPETAIPLGAKSIDAKGLDVWPGMIDSGTYLGLYEIGSIAETQDYADSATIEPELLTSTALHPDSELIGVTRANGVLSAFVEPSGGLVSGQGCIIDLNGWVPSEMVVVDRAGLHIQLPSRGRGDSFGFNRPNEDEGSVRNPQSKQQLDQIKDEFQQALAYNKLVTESAAKKLPPPAPDPRLSALIPYAKGEKPVILTADYRGDILDALALAKDLKIKAVISGGLEAWKVASELKEANVPVLIGGTMRVPLRVFDPYDAAYANPGKLYAAGVKFAIRSAGRGPNLGTAGRNLPYEAAMAVAYGLPEEEALKSVTLYPAQILGVADRLGSLEVGKRANLVITAGHLLQPTTEVKELFIAGKPLAPESRHTRLYNKYRERLAEVQSGYAPLGIEIPAKAAAGSSPAASASPVEPAPINPANRR